MLNKVMNTFPIPAACWNVAERNGRFVKTPPPRTHVTKNEMGVFSVEIFSSTDYYAFGMQIPGRNFSSPSYRFGFNGKEKDNEFKGDGNSYDFTARILDVRLGRWLSLDAFAKVYPGISSYSYVFNNPISKVDKGGFFVIDPNDPDAPQLRVFIEIVRETLISDPYLLNKFLEHSGFTIEELDIIFTEGKGPILRYATGEDKFPSIAIGEWLYYTGITNYGVQEGQFSSEILLNRDIFTNASSFVQLITILHELVHFGDLAEDQIGYNKEYYGYSTYQKIKEQNLRYYGKSFSKSGYDPEKTIEPGLAFEVEVTGNFGTDYLSYLLYKSHVDPFSESNIRKRESQNRKNNKKGNIFDTRPLNENEVNRLKNSS